MKLYHGTSEWRAEAIMSEGFVGSHAVNFRGEDLEGVYTFFSDNEEHARMYGDCVVVVRVPEDAPMTRWNGYGPNGDDEIIIDTDFVNAECGIEEII